MGVKKGIKKIPFLKPIFRQRKAASGYGLAFINFLFQRIFRINGGCKYQVHYTSYVGFPKNIHLEGDSTKKSLARSPCCYFQAKNGIEIKEGTIWGPGVKIISANHADSDDCKYSRLEKKSPIKIGKDCWIASNAVILPGVELGKNTIVGAGAVVTKSFREGNIKLAGVPAKPLSEK